jgi:hypothetical protein
MRQRIPSSSTDVLSVVAMRESGEIMLKYHPFDWILYNHLVDLMQRSKPSNGGFYFPALDAAESLLSVNRNRNCALALFFLSDGRPSDKMKRGDFGGYEYTTMTRYCKERIGRLARCFGKRLAVCAAAIGEPHKDEFQVMKGMIDEAKQYECPVVFQPACLSAGALEKTIMTMTSTTTTKMTTISEVAGGSGDDELTLRKTTTKRSRPARADPLLGVCANGGDRNTRNLETNAIHCSHASG